jgi:hypothetical protein
LHLSSTTNIVERLFSVMTPYHLELLLFLRSNKSLWTEVTRQEILDKPPTSDATASAEPALEQESLQNSDDEDP